MPEWLHATLPTRETPAGSCNTRAQKACSCRKQDLPQRSDPTRAAIPAKSRRGMAPRRSAGGCIRRPQSSRWTRRGPHPPRSELMTEFCGGAKSCCCGAHIKARVISESPCSRASVAAALWEKRRGRAAGEEEERPGREEGGADEPPPPTPPWSVEPRNTRPLDAPPDTWLWPSPLFPSRVKLRSCQISRKKLRDASALLVQPPHPPCPVVSYR